MNLDLSTRVDPELRQAWYPQRRAAIWCWGGLVGSTVAFFGYAYPMLFEMTGLDAHGSWLSSIAAPRVLSIAYGNVVFASSGVFLMIAAWLLWCARHPRALDPELLRRCRKTRMYNRWALKCAAGFWLLAVIVVYIATSLHRTLGGP